MAGSGSVGVHGWGDMKSLTIQVITGRWFVVFASFLIMSGAGATYMFGLYSSDIKKTLGYDQTTINLLSFFKDVGTNVGLLSGLINEFMPPWVVLAIGAVLNFFGYFMIWLSVTQKIARPQVWQMCLYIFIGANSQSFANTGSLVTCVKNFPESRGVVLGILKGYLGLSGAIITQLYSAIYYHDTKALILLIGWLPAAISFVFLRTIRYMKPIRQPNELKVFYKFLYISLGLAGFLLVMIIIQQRVNFKQSEYGVSTAVVLLLLFLPVAVIFIEEYKIQQSKRLALVDPSPVKVVTEGAKVNPNESTNGQSKTVSHETQDTRWWQNVFSPPDRGEDYTILQVLFSIDMLILFVASICGIGGTLTAVDNLGQIGASLRYPKKSISTFVSLVSIWNYLGRVFAGFASEHILTKYKFPRPLVLSLTMFLACIGHLLIAFDVPNGLYVASVIIGFSFGAQWPLLFAIISELFGLKYYATLFNFGSAASPIGLYVLNVRITGPFYDKEAKKQLAALGLQRKPGQELNCVGVDCFKLSFIIITAATFIGAVISLFLVARTRKFYRGDIYKKFRGEASAEQAEVTGAENGGRELGQMGKDDVDHN
ncbi:protein NUCLEAR FUSION DEFECTIVE 4-like [Gastrolobium bilobum]|uniref:protein NUCLEAR FUSION DEFECTIVE 4-like n=1 Tax=Gastrolobium bilobum TaxID=150636 RepID=UPI002AAF62E3|nr:protein NUCLEAR FUSION DEFECTIVE 4-like [Gastrolobium bilobum]